MRLMNTTADEIDTWIQYNKTQNLWQCCGDNVCIGTVTGETFSAIAPSQWSAVPSLQSTTSFSASATATFASSRTASPSSTSIEGGNEGDNGGKGNGTGKANKNNGSDGGLSTGAQAGIGVGCGIVGAALIAGVVYLVWRRRRTTLNEKMPNNETRWQQEQQCGDTTPYYGDNVPGYGESGQQKSVAPQEMDAVRSITSPQELANTALRPQELEAGQLEDRQKK